MREASQLFSDDFLEDVAVERQVRHDLFELAVFVAQRPELAQLRETQAGELLLPAVEGLLADAEPATDLGDFLAALDLVQGVASLLRPFRGIWRLLWPAPPACLGNHRSFVFHLSAVPISGFWVRRNWPGRLGRSSSGAD